MSSLILQKYNNNKYLLEGLNPIAAYSLTLRKRQFQPCFNARRLNDNATQNIGFSGNKYDKESVNNFAPDGYRLAIIYDQSGNGLALSQATNDNQSQVYQDSIILNNNGYTFNYSSNTNAYLVLNTVVGAAIFGIYLINGTNNINNFTSKIWGIKDILIFTSSSDAISCLTRLKGDNLFGVSSFHGAFDSLSKVIDYSFLDTSNGIDLAYAWAGYPNSTFPLLDFSNATNLDFTWSFSQLANFPLVNTSKVASFEYTWGNTQLNFMPLINTSSGIYFQSAWIGARFNTFPALNFDRALNFTTTWYYCNQMVNFAPNRFDNCLCTDYTLAFSNCALNEVSVDNILVSVAFSAINNNLNNGTLDINGGSNSTPSSTGLTAKATLQSKGWNVNTN
jgi:hypothetical protein